jgi:ATP-dependent Clp protease ATP-binding subunit ClpA
MFERFTERSRQVVVLAQEEARALKHNYIGTEHLLLGLLREEEGLAARVLDSLEITIDDVRAQIVRFVGKGAEDATGQIPFTPRARNVLEHALREGLAPGGRGYIGTQHTLLGQGLIGTEHLLLGLMRENEGIAARILVERGADAATIRNELIRMLSGPPRGGERPTSRRRRPMAWGGEAPTRPPRLTRGARNVLIFAQDEARALKHAGVDTEHVLLGLLSEGQGLAARLLDALEIRLDDVRARVLRTIGEGSALTTGHLPFTPRTKDMLERARQEALSLGHDYVGTEHILLSLMRQDGGIAAGILRRYRR